MQIKLNKADKKEIVQETRDYLKAMGIARPTEKQIRDQIAHEHGDGYADAVFNKE